MSRLPLLLAVAIAAACAPATQRAYVAPSPETIVSTTEQHEADPPSHTIYIENHSTVPVTVFSVYLTNCQNIHGECGPHPVKLRVPAAGRVMAMRIQPANPQQSYYYRFGFSWHEDSSSTAALAALAQSGDQGSRAKLAAMQRADSERRAETGPQFNELSRNDYTALAGKVTALRAYPESLVMVPGTRASVDQIRLLLVDARGQVLGRTRWVRWRAPGAGAVEFLPPDALVARRPGRSTIRFNLADEAQQALGTSLGELEYPLIAAYPPNPHAPVFEGLALDGDSRKPLACARVALEDSAQNVVVRDRTGPTGTFMLAAPRPGTYRVRVEAPGWAPVYGPSELAGLDEEKQHEYLVKFTEQMLSARFARDGEDIEHARPVAVSTGPVGAPA